MEFRILGPLEVLSEGRALELGRQKQRALLSVLLLNANQVVSSDELIEALWDGTPPETAGKALQVHVSLLRKLVGGERLQTKRPGYLLRVEPEEFDLARCRRLAAEGRPDDALALWRGSPLGEFAYQEFARTEIRRLEEFRLALLEERIEQDLAGGRQAEMIGELEALVAEHATRERLRGQLMLALYRSGRQADALDVFREGRRSMVDGLGIEPSRKLRELHQAILNQDPALDLAFPPAAETHSSRGGFVGRDAELGALSAGLDDAFAARGRLFLIVGEPGIGKSRLADELISRARTRGARVLVGRCWEAGGAPAYWPWLQMLGAYIDETDTETLRSELGPQAAVLAQLLPELHELYPDLTEPSPLEPDRARFRLFTATASFLSSAAVRSPLVLVLDDLHAADEPTLLLLRFVSRELEGSRVLILCAYRNVDPKPARSLLTALTELAREPATRTLSLGGLTESDVGRFIELSTAYSPSSGVVETVHAGTEGNPLYVGEIVRSLAAEGRLDEPEARLAVPQSLREVIARRLRHLSPECERVLSLASVIGREFNIDVLARVCGLERLTLLDLLDDPIAEQLVADVPGSRVRLRFGHALFREGMYDELPSSRRREHHRVVGEALESLYSDTADSHLAELAHHFCEAVPAIDPGKAVDYAQRAGDQAVGLLAPEEAVRLYETALSLVDERDRPRLLLRTAWSMWMAGLRGAERATEARDALIASGDREGAAEAELLLANIHWYEGRRTLVSEAIERALRLVPTRPATPTTANVLDHASRFHMLADEETEAISVGRQGLAIAEQLGLHGVRAHCLNNIGVARVCLGDLAGLDDIELALEIAVTAQDGWATWRAHANLADCLLWHVGDADRAVAHRHEIRRLVQTAGAWPAARWSQSYDAWETYWGGRWTETLRLCDEFIEQVELGHPHNIASEMYLLRALISASQGADTALEDARAAVILGREAQDGRNLYLAIAVNAQIAAELGRSDEADRLLHELLIAEGPEPFPAYVGPLSLAAVARAREEDAFDRLDLIVPTPWRDAATATLRGEHLDAAKSA
jgi:DNA-binding SARP family transcriptional activator